MPGMALLDPYSIPLGTSARIRSVDCSFTPMGASFVAKYGGEKDMEPPLELHGAFRVRAVSTRGIEARACLSSPRYRRRSNRQVIPAKRTRQSCHFAGRLRSLPGSSDRIPNSYCQFVQVRGKTDCWSHTDISDSSGMSSCRRHAVRPKAYNRSNI
ncbi:hypothetical protein BCR34DRAFT_385862 [Clohesyomyces aquaticus]|uniref:Uncharacterized protein n=1 Tax=Clohesyomyces aquaticus TaxID=1231657 RepID=A0A1Y1ZFA8_9PLEO|nr:hypothetical protein BCR34DRAFT_385862 [Clohesyomyces aquaticus]